MSVPVATLCDYPEPPCYTLLNILHLVRGIRSFFTTMLTPYSFNKIVILMFALMLLGSGVILANPDGEQVIHGSASFDRDAGTLIVRNSNGAIIQWDSFSIEEHELTRFLQSNSDSAVLNRVVGNELSRIYGSLESNGRVFLVNPNGILVGPQGQINTAGFVASTLDVSDDAFLSGETIQFTGESTAGVTNLGVIRTTEGDVLLLAYQVTNAGEIHAANRAGLYAGQDILIASPHGGHALVNIAGIPNVAQAGTGVDNTGIIEAAQAELQAAGGNVYALAINNEGTVRATGAVRSQGQVILKSNGGDIRNTGTLAAHNLDGSGGYVSIDSGDGGTAYVSGTVDASGEYGGQVDVTGSRVAVYDEARVDASGNYGGGDVRIGGGLRGQDADIQNADYVYVGESAVVSVDATEQGDGGTVTVWAEQSNRFYGTVSARGGATSGDGGFVETSARHSLEAVGHVDTGAAHGQAGKWLIDPNDITIQNTGPDTNINPSTSYFGSSDDSSILTTATLVSALNAGGVVAVETTSSGTNSQEGNIYVNDNITKTWAGAAALNLIAHKDVIINGVTISSTNGKLDLIIKADKEQNMGGAVYLAPSTIIDTNGGDVVIGGGTNAGSQFAQGHASRPIGVEISQSQISTGAGLLTINGQSAMDSSYDAYGVSIENSQITTTTGNIVITGIAMASGGEGKGVSLSGSSITTQDGDIQVFGQGSPMADTSGEFYSGYNVGVYGGNLEATGTGSINVTGQGGEGDYSAGVSNVSASVNDGDLTITGSGGTGMDSPGVLLGSGDLVSNGAGNITVTGIANNTDSLGIAREFETTSTIGGPNATGVVTLLADSMNLEGTTFEGQGEMRFAPVNPETSVAIGDGVTGDLHFTQADLDNVSSAFSQITIGHPAAVAPVTVGMLTLPNNLMIDAGSASLEFTQTLDLLQNDLIIFGGSNVSQSAGIHAARILFFGTDSDYYLTNPDNHVGNLIGYANSLHFVGVGPIRIGDAVHGFGMNTASALFVESLGINGDIVIDNSIQAGWNALPGETTIALIAARDFINNAGAEALDPGEGRFVVISTAPDSNQLDGLIAQEVFEATPDDYASFPAGNVLAYTGTGQSSASSGAGSTTTQTSSPETPLLNTQETFDTIIDQTEIIVEEPGSSDSLSPDSLGLEEPDVGDEDSGESDSTPETETTTQSTTSSSGDSANDDATLEPGQTLAFGANGSAGANIQPPQELGESLTPQVRDELSAALEFDDDDSFEPVADGNTGDEQTPAAARRFAIDSSSSLATVPANETPIQRGEVINVSGLGGLQNVSPLFAPLELNESLTPQVRDSLSDALGFGDVVFDDSAAPQSNFGNADDGGSIGNVATNSGATAPASPVQQERPVESGEAIRIGRNGVVLPAISLTSPPELDLALTPEIRSDLAEALF